MRICIVTIGNRFAVVCVYFVETAFHYNCQCSVYFVENLFTPVVTQGHRSVI